MYKSSMYQKMVADQTQHLEKNFILKWQDLCRYTWLKTLKSDDTGSTSGYSEKHNLIGTTNGQPGIDVLCKDTLLGFKGILQHKDEGRLVVVSASALSPSSSWPSQSVVTI